MLVFFLIGIGFAAAPAPPAAPAYLVAHRGVVTEAIPENSLASLEETIRRGYTHVEVDIRRTADGRLVCLHDRGLHRIAGVKAFVDEMTYESFREALPEERAPSFEGFCEAAEGRIAIMPDVKDVAEDQAAAVAAEILRILSAHHLLENALFIGDGRVKDAVRGRARVAVSADTPRATLEKLITGGCADAIFAFGHAKDFDLERVRLFQGLGIPVIVSVNLLHYLGRDAVAEGLRDVKRMLELGVDGLQIDTEYEAALGRPAAAPALDNVHGAPV
ncbi:MAG: hypothetical protein IT368_13640 [Candidatus Hydrogenedentes bacterium]|nr:hypothetical protein [Candidatus Hydrogenedentota bacterium]